MKRSSNFISLAIIGVLVGTCAVSSAVGQVVHRMPDLYDVVKDMARDYPDTLSKVDKTSKDDKAWEFTDRVIQKLHSIDPRFGYRERDLSWGNPNVLTPFMSIDTFVYAEGAHSAQDHTNTNGPIQVVDFIGGASGPNPRPRWGPVEWANDPGAYTKLVYPRPGAPNYGYDPGHPGAVVDGGTTGEGTNPRCSVPNKVGVLKDLKDRFPAVFQRGSDLNHIRATNGPGSVSLDDPRWEFMDMAVAKLRETDKNWGFHCVRGNCPDISTDAIGYSCHQDGQVDDHFDVITGSHNIAWQSAGSASSGWIYPRPGTSSGGGDGEVCDQNVPNQCLVGEFSRHPRDTTEEHLWSCRNLPNGAKSVRCRMARSEDEGENMGKCGRIANTCSGGDFHPFPHDTATLHRWSCRNRPHNGQMPCEKSRSEDNNNPRLGRCSRTPNYCDGGELHTLTNDDAIPRFKERIGLNPNVESGWIVDGQKLWVCRNTQTHYDKRHTGEIFCPADLAYGQEE